MKLFSKILLNITAALIICLTLLVIFSPYGKKEGFDRKVLITDIKIKKPASLVFNYLGDSRNASEWSVFVDHIIPINGDEVGDGQVGSLRRCFKYPNRKGLQWDEEIIEVIPNKKRMLTIFNLVNFPVTADNMYTEQLYFSEGTEQFTLAFTVFFEDENPGVLNSLKMYIAAYKIKSILEDNLKNIKYYTEKL